MSDGNLNQEGSTERFGERDVGSNPTPRTKNAGNYEIIHSYTLVSNKYALNAIISATVTTAKIIVLLLLTKSPMNFFFDVK